MYGFEPSEEQRMLIDAIHRYAAADVRPAAHEADETGEIPPQLIRKGWELGWLQASLPETYGGFGEHSAVTGVLAAEALAWGDLAIALAVMCPALFAVPVLLCGDEAQKQAHLPPIAAGEWPALTAAAIEPRRDYSLGSLTTTAEKQADGYILRGEKAMVPYADRAESVVVYANLDGTTQAFLVPRGAEGLHVGQREQLLGLDALPCFPVVLEEVKLPLGARMGQDNEKAGKLMASATVATAALGIGLSQAAYEYALAYAKEREAFGAPIAQKQAVAFMLAEMATEISAARLLVWEAAWMIDQDGPAGREAYLAQVGAADTAMMVTDRAVQILGGHGYIREHPVELWMRNARGISSLIGLAVV
jgi:acyl-CoA dehydrogenase